ncbi:MAG: hypothetical protein JXQ84_00690 [Rhodospirillaceae bacterium]|nr:hypothetical protein [Rhodospirillaceae bacterium]
MVTLGRFFGVVVCAAGLLGGLRMADAATPTPEQCAATYRVCDAACQAADPKHGFSYAGCAAKCVAAKAACESEIIYDDTSRWTKKQYEAAKPWVEKKASEAKTLINEAPANKENTYPSQNTGN